MQRLHEAFNAQLSPESPSSLIPRTRGTLTPSTTNDSTRSTGRSSEDQWLVSLEQSPSVAHTSQQFTLALGVTSTMLSSDSLATPQSWLPSNNGHPASPIISTHLSSTDNDLLLPSANSPVPFKHDNDNPFDLDQYMVDIEGNTVSQPNS